jgi:hypothetical protein
MLSFVGSDSLEDGENLIASLSSVLRYEIIGRGCLKKRPSYVF